MRYLFVVALLSTVFTLANAGNYSVDAGQIMEKDAYEWLMYDDGTANWLTWGGVYRGVWFNTEDFYPGGGSSLIAAAEFWFYHSADRPWDTGDFYAELWDGNSEQPTVLLDRQMVSATHFFPVYVYYDPPIPVSSNFWLLVNTELSAGGWPAVLGDGTPGVHSFFSDDFILWEPWGDMGDFFIAALVEPQALYGTSWARLKACFAD